MHPTPLPWLCFVALVMTAGCADEESPEGDDDSGGFVTTGPDDDDSAGGLPAGHCVAEVHYAASDPRDQSRHEYDAEGRLVQVELVGAAPGSWELRYDSAGRLARTRSAGGSGRDTADYSWEDDRLMAVAWDSNGDGVYERRIDLRYDADGLLQWGFELHEDELVARLVPQWQQAGVLQRLSRELPQGDEQWEAVEEWQLVRDVEGCLTGTYHSDADGAERVVLARDHLGRLSSVGFDSDGDAVIDTSHDVEYGGACGPANVGLPDLPGPLQVLPAVVEPRYLCP